MRPLNFAFVLIAAPSGLNVLCFVLFFQETYLMKHMSKHTMVEHLISHHSPQHRTESPAIPIRISLIWVSSAPPPSPTLPSPPPPPPIRDVFCTPALGQPTFNPLMEMKMCQIAQVSYGKMLFQPTWRPFKKKKDHNSINEDIQRWLHRTFRQWQASKLVFYVTPQEDKLLWAATSEIFVLQQTTLSFFFFLKGSNNLICSSLDKQKLVCARNSPTLRQLSSLKDSKCSYKVLLFTTSCSFLSVCAVAEYLAMSHTWHCQYAS